MIINSFFCHTIYNANKYQYNLHNFDSLNLRPYFFIIIFFKFNILCTFQFPMCMHTTRTAYRKQCRDFHSSQKSHSITGWLVPNVVSEQSGPFLTVHSVHWRDVNLSKIRPLCSLPTSVNYYSAIKHHVPEEQRPQLHHCKSPKPHILSGLLVWLHMCNHYKRALKCWHSSYGLFSCNDFQLSDTGKNL